MNKLKVLDLFCGCGGLSKGLSDSGLEIMAGIDIWNIATESYRENLKHMTQCKDLTKYSPKEFEKDYLKYYNKDKNDIDIVVGGPSCQGFSIAGKRDKNDPRNSLFMEFVKYLNYFKPKSFLMENVVGILSMKTTNNENVIDIIMNELEKEYIVRYYKLYASDFEVPQNRRRVIFIGFRKDLNIYPFEPKTINEDNRIPVKTVLELENSIDEKHFLSQKALDGIKRKKAKSLKEGKGFGAQFLDLEKPSFTIVARYYKDGYDGLVKYTDTRVRRLTVLELKRIQTFPDDYILKGNRKEQIMQIGNAVACRFAYHLGKYLQRMLTIKDKNIKNDLNTKFNKLRDRFEKC